MIRKGILLMYFVGVCHKAFTQNDSVPSNKLDDQYQPAGKSVFNNESAKGNLFSGRVSVPLKGALKIVPFQLFRGNVLAESEIALGNSYTFMFGFGYQVMADKMLENFSSSGPFGYDMAFGFKNPDFLNPDELLKNATFLKGGPVVKLGLRIYLSSFSKVFFSRYYGHNFIVDGRAINHWYQNLSVTYGSFAYQLDTAARYSGLKIENANSFQVKSFFLLGGFGYSYALNGRIKTIHDFYFNFGIRYLRFSSFEKVQTSPPLQTPPNIVYLSTGELRNRLLIPSIHVGYSFGFGF